MSRAGHLEIEPAQLLLLAREAAEDNSVLSVDDLTSQQRLWLWMLLAEIQESAEFEQTWTATAEDAHAMDFRLPTKNTGGSWFGIGSPGQQETGRNPVNGDGIKQHGSGPEWFDNGICKSSSRSDSRKAASAMIAEIPFDLAQWIARCFKPCTISAESSYTGHTKGIDRADDAITRASDAGNLHPR